jgi:methionine-rich copper-binding protein CopC
MSTKNRWVTNIGIIVLATLVGGLIGLTPAAAHMGVAESNPANGSSVPIAPELLSITFSIDVQLDTAKSQLRYIGGLDAPISDMNRRDVRTVALQKTSGTGPGSMVTFMLPELAAGLYAIDWSVDEIDGHTNNAVILFKVTDGVVLQPEGNGVDGDEPNGQTPGPVTAVTTSEDVQNATSVSESESESEMFETITGTEESDQTESGANGATNVAVAAAMVLAVVTALVVYLRRRP